MNIIFMAKDCLASVHALNYLIEKCSSKIKVACAIVRENIDVEFAALCKDADIPILSEKDMLERYKDSSEIDYIFSFYWKRIGNEILAIPTKGGINFHPGPLPEARGSGYHTAIIEDWGYWGVTAHYMESQFDTGNIIDEERFEIPTDILNYELVELAHKKNGLLFERVVNKLIAGEKFSERPQSEGRYFSKSDVEEAKEVFATDSIDLINRKIRAFWHPPYTGAFIKINGNKLMLVNEDVLKKL